MEYSRSSSLKWILFYIIVGAIAYNGLYFFFFYQNEDFNQYRTSSANWIAYVGDGFSFKYPREFTLNENYLADSKLIRVENMKKFPDIFCMSICARDCGEYSEEAENIGNATDDMINGYSIKQIVLDHEVIVYFNKTHNQNKFQAFNPDNFERSGKIIAFVGKNNENLKTFNEILSTFEFTGMPAPVGWKTYTDRTLGFTYDYPETFQWGWANRPLYAWQEACKDQDFTKKCPSAKEILYDKIGGVGMSETFYEDNATQLLPVQATYNKYPFCNYSYSEGAAGTTYINQYYVVERNNTCTTLLYVLDRPNCQNYFPLEQGNAEQEKNYNNCVKMNESAPKTLEKILSTFSFTK